jgi:hypothetical protein
MLQVLVEQLTVSPLNNILFMIYYGWIVEGKLISVIHAYLEGSFTMRTITGFILLSTIY